jgi:cyclopropane fatty-acyl-phospholipid synthase-like methyltransferase
VVSMLSGPMYGMLHGRERVVEMTVAPVDHLGYVSSVQAFFDEQYTRHGRYWWKNDNRYSLEPTRHTPFHAKVLQLATQREPGRALDIGAGEGADAIRLAKLEYTVDAIELSSVACEKIEMFAREEGVKINIRNEPALLAKLEEGVYDIVIMNGSLHYIKEKAQLLHKVKQASASGALHIMSLFSTATPVPAEHAAIPVFPDVEQGEIEQFYSGEQLVQLSYVRGKLERSHPGFARHEHSFINQIVRLAERV